MRLLTWHPSFERAPYWQVFWPILLLYFIALFVLTMKRQIKHMIKYKYVPFSLGKTRYKGRDDDGAPPRKSAE